LEFEGIIWGFQTLINQQINKYI